MSERKPHIIVFGNEKGGSGKSTTAMHVAVALMRLGKSVVAIDLDSRQRTLTRYIENRETWTKRTKQKLTAPRTIVVERSPRDSAREASDEEMTRLEAAFASAGADTDFVVIDTPGSDTNLARLGHVAADTLVTPMNDSFIDFDLLGAVDGETYKVAKPNFYAELVWESRKRRAMLGWTPMDWVVMRNRVSSLEARNKRRVGDALDAFAQRVGFRVAPGFSERVIYRELFPLGLTLLDLHDVKAGIAFTMSHVAARQEVRELVAMLNLPGVGSDLGRL